MQKLKIINEQQILGENCTIYGDFSEPLFLASDLTKWLDCDSVESLLQLVDENEKVKLSKTDNKWYVTEYGFYGILFRSKKPEAKEFRNEVKRILKEFRVNEIEKLKRTKQGISLFSHALNNSRRFAKVAGIPEKDALTIAIKEIEEATDEDFSVWLSRLETPRASHNTAANHNDFQQVTHDSETDPVSTFWNEFQSRFAWKLLPTAFLHTLYTNWCSINGCDFHMEGYNTFKSKLEAIVLNDPSSPWTVATNPVYIKGKITTHEPLIMEYNLDDWKNKKYKGSDPAKICTPTMGSRQRGLVLKTLLSPLRQPATN